MRPSLTLTSRRLIHLRSPLGLPVLRLVPVACMPFAITPAGPMKPVRSHCSIGIGLPRSTGGSAPAFAFSRPAQRSLVLRPARSLSRHCDPFHRRLQRLRYLHHCFDCYRAERTSSRAGLPPAVDQRLFTAHCRYRHKSHATGQPKRLNRDSIAEAAPFGSATYRAEECVAEMTAAYLCG